MKCLNDVGEVPQIHLGVGCHLPGRQKTTLESAFFSKSIRAPRW